MSRLYSYLYIHILNYIKFFKNYIKFFVRVDWKVHRLTKILSWDVANWDLFFNIVPQRSKHFFHQGCIAWIRLVKKSSTAEMTSSYEILDLFLYNHPSFVLWISNYKLINSLVFARLHYDVSEVMVKWCQRLQSINDHVIIQESILISNTVSHGPLLIFLLSIYETGRIF